jgi:cytochrome c6
MKGEVMKMGLVSIFVFLTSVGLAALPFFAAGVSVETSGEALFQQHCAACHPGGNNVLNPKKTLHKKDLEANNILTAQDIVNKIRNPGPAPTHPQEWAGMRSFDRKTIPDEDAIKIANYILETFQ